jgi:probable F420-dependent oxidoreductase
MELGRLGVWSILDGLPAPEAAAFARRVEQWGYGALWISELNGRNPMVAASWLLANTKRLNVATGIAATYARAAVAAMSGQLALAEQSGGRFLLGLGVSHGPLVEGMWGQSYEKPVPTMKAYLAKMHAVNYRGVQPAEKPKTVLAALGPKMLEVAATLADGAHPYNVTPDHTAFARKILGPGKLLCPEQMVVLETDAAAARAVGRRHLARYLVLPNYRNNFFRFGFTADDADNGGSDRLIDAIIAWGDEAAIRKRIQDHWDAGADHVCIQSLPKEGWTLTKDDQKILELLAPG